MSQWRARGNTPARSCSSLPSLGGGFAAEKMLPQIPRWGWLTYSIVAGIVSIPLIYGPEIKAWWSKRKGIIYLG